MRLAPSVFLTVLVFGAGCSDDERTSTKLAAYHLEEAWAESKPAADKEDLKIPAGAKVVRCGPPALACPGALEVPRRTLYYAFTGKPPLTTLDFDVDTAKKAFDPNQETIVRVRLTKEGRVDFTP
jgi:hypothetical protein